jgi:hypothetical protein
MAIRYTQAERTGYVDAFKASGLSQTAFCKTQNISFKSFNNWVRLDSPGRLKKCSSSSDSWAHHLKSAPLNQSLMVTVQTSTPYLLKDAKILETAFFCI